MKPENIDVSQKSIVDSLETRPTLDNFKVNPQVIVLGAGSPYRGSKPSALSPMPDHRCVLDWIFDAFSSFEADFHYVGGYQVNEVAKLYKGFSISINPDWQFTGNVASLFTAPLSDQRACYVCYSDVVFRRNVVERLAAAPGDVVLAVDFDWQRRYGARADEDLRAAEKVKLKDGVVLAVGSQLKVADAQAEFTGLAKISGDAMRRIMQLRESAGDSLRRASLPALIDKLRAQGIEIRIVDVNGDWAELNAPQDLARFVLGTKAETLDRLRPLVRKSVIGEQVRLTLEKWNGDKEASVDQVAQSFGDKRIIVRSSALTEDSWSTANAGAFLSLLDIAGNNREGIASAVDRVFASYGDDNHGHQVLVQEMVSDVGICGVALTRSLNYGAPYYVINYDDTPLDTESVTSGSGQDLKTLVIHRGSQLVPDGVPEGLQLFLEALWELEGLVGHDSLDVEFAITSDNVIHIFQLRPIAVDHSDWHGTDDKVANLLATAVEIFHVKQASSPFVVGRRAMFGIMPDWNPAEIIGTNPRRLAVSLYRHLVTDEVWAAERAEYGYRDVRPQPLMVLFAGRPYIDIRASFNSFLPKQLDEALAEKLLDHYLDRLEANPHLHDKIEFDVAFTSLTFDFDMRAERLRASGFSSSEISQLADALREITRQAFYRNDEDLAQVKRLEQRFEQTMRSEMNPLDRAYILLEDCRRYGTLPFSHLARSAFVAVNLLRSAAARGIIDTSTVSDFLGSLKTVAKDLSHDAKDVANGGLAWESFVERYGHLRPGTYDITLPSYSEDPEHFLRPLVEQAGQTAQQAEKKFSWSSEQCRSMAEALRSIDFPDDIDLFDQFLRQAIEGREYAKFAFTRNLNAALHDLAEFAAELGLTRDQVSHIPLDDLYALSNGACPADVGEWLQNKAEEGASWHEHSLGIELPPLLIRPDNFYRFLYPKTQPNFISDGKVTGPVLRLDDDADTTGDVAGKIVLIPQADPGYDWLLGHAVSGLITAYGGTNSHMAIRAAEFRLPAAIGVGQTLYDRLAHAEIICLDCQNRRIEIVR